jgi:hypothetical protein
VASIRRMLCPYRDDTSLAGPEKLNKSHAAFHPRRNPAARADPDD